jgi:glycine/D-amino acid oxidase-like deaminating enzyme
VLVGGGLGGNGLSVALPLGCVLADWIRLGEPRSLPGAERLVPRPARTVLATSDARNSA